MAYIVRSTSFSSSSSLQMSTASPSQSVEHRRKNAYPQFLQSRVRRACQIRASFESSNYSTSKVVTIRYSDLIGKSADLSKELEAGFGPNRLGIIAISDVPKYPCLRKNLLQLSHRLGALPDEEKRNLEDPDSRYSFGWSHGKEKLESGQLDKLKGSFYANPLVDIPTNDETLIQRYPSYCRQNVWPTRTLPELEPAFKDLGRLIFNVGLLLAYHCDKYVAKRDCEAPSLEVILDRSKCHKGRLLHYFPVMHSDNDQSSSTTSWCGWHTDHGSLTGLTCAMYMKGNSEMACPDNTAGLYIKTRTDATVKAIYGENNIAYQVGEAMEMLSKGLFHATPHYVKAPRGDKANGIERNTFALFMQPNWDEPMYNLDSVAYLHKELTKSNGSIMFGDYSEKILNKYYGLRS